MYLKAATLFEQKLYLYGYKVYIVMCFSKRKNFLHCTLYILVALNLTF